MPAGIGPTTMPRRHMKKHRKTQASNTTKRRNTPKQSNDNVGAHLASDVAGREQQPHRLNDSARAALRAKLRRKCAIMRKPMRELQQEDMLDSAAFGEGNEQDMMSLLSLQPNARHLFESFQSMQNVGKNMNHKMKSKMSRKLKKSNKDDTRTNVSAIQAPTPSAAPEDQLTSNEEHKELFEVSPVDECPGTAVSDAARQAVTTEHSTNPFDTIKAQIEERVRDHQRSVSSPHTEESAEVPQYFAQELLEAVENQTATVVADAFG